MATNHQEADQHEEIENGSNCATDRANCYGGGRKSASAQRNYLCLRLVAGSTARVESFHGRHKALGRGHGGRIRQGCRSVPAKQPLYRPMAQGM